MSIKKAAQGAHRHMTLGGHCPCCALSTSFNLCMARETVTACRMCKSHKVVAHKQIRVSKGEQAGKILNSV